MERLAYLYLALLITLLNFLKTIFLMLKVHSCKSENLSVNSPAYYILELYSSLVTFYHNVHYKQRKIRSYRKAEWFSMKIINLMEIFKIRHKYFSKYSFSTSITLPSRLQISSFSTDLILLQNKIKYYRKAKKINLVSICCIALKYFAKYTH